MKEKFSKGKAPFAITGPWATDDFKKAGVKFAVGPVPSINGKTPGVFVGVQGFMISAFSKKSDVAKTFLLKYMATEELQTAMYKAGSRAPALTSAFKKIADDPVATGFGQSGLVGQPMPAIPAMGKVWDAWTKAYELTFSGKDATAAFKDAAAAIRTAIG
jgi:arabinogalactan oligomer / maltooligosaccharide transport system substrate-binding protein